MRHTILFVLLVAAPVSAQTATIQDNTRRAAELIDAAVVAHGGLDALRAARQAYVRIEGSEFHRYQSTRPDGPLDSTFMRHDVHLDLDHDRAVVELTRGYPGGFYYTTRRIYAPGDSVRFIDTRNGTYTLQPRGPNDLFGAGFPLPQNQLLAAHQSNPRTRRYLGRLRLASGTEVEAVTFPLPNGNTMTVGFDPRTHLLRSDMGVALDPLDAQAVAETELLDYRQLGGLLLPTRRLAYRGRDTLSDVRFVDARAGYGVPDSLVTIPPRFRVAPVAPAAQAVRGLAPGVWRVDGGGSASLLIEMRDHLVVVDANWRTAATVLQNADSLAPGKPIRFVIPTHHHDDHFTGARTYAQRAAATIVTTAGNRDFLRRVLANPGLPVTAETAPVPDARVELLNGSRRVFTDGARTLEIHDIGPNAHAEEMLVAWLPAEGILFTADLIEAQAGVAQPGANAHATMQLANWLRRNRLTVRAFIGAHGDLISADQFQRLTAYPVVPAAESRSNRAANDAQHPR